MEPGVVFFEFIKSLSVKISASGIYKAISMLDISSMSSFSRYKNRLKKRLEEMPFLYQEIKLSARDDYVEIQLVTRI